MGWVRVTVASATRRVDLALPSALPVAELVPELARSVGLLDARTVHGGYRLRTQDGRPLAGDAGLTSQGVADGGLLTIDAHADDPVSRRYDDEVEAMADVVEREFQPVGPAVLRLLALAGGELLLLLGALSLALHRNTHAGVAAALIASLLIAVLVNLRGRSQGAVPLTLAWTATAFGAVAGLGLAADSGSPGMQFAAAGAGAFVTVVAALMGLGEHRLLLVPLAIVGGVLGAGGTLVHTTGLHVAEAMTAVTVFGVVGGSFLPRLSLGMSEEGVGGRHRRLEVAEVDQDALRAAAVVGHRILLAGTSAVGLLIVVVTPLAVSLGITGTLVAAFSACVLMLGSRHRRSGAVVLAALVFGIAALVVAALSVLWQHPGWGSAVPVVLVAAGATVLALTLIPPSSARRARLAEVAETLAVVSLMPLLAMATVIAGPGG